MARVSLDELEKRMKRLELNMNAERKFAQQPESSGAIMALSLDIPNTDLPGSEFPRKNAHTRNASLGRLNIGNSYNQLVGPPTPHGTSDTSHPFSSLYTQNISKQNRPTSGLDLSSSGANSPAMQRKKKLAMNYSLQTGPTENNKSIESVDVNQRLREVISQNGKLRLGSMCYKANSWDFENLGEIGSGTCGQVFQMRFKPTDLIMAVKQMHRSGNNEENKRILMDLDVVQKSNFSHIVKCYGTLVTESHVWICMELMSTCFDKLLKKLKGPVPEYVLGKLTAAVVKALDYLKEHHGVIHRDVKPSNILIDKTGTIKLCDFGISGRLVDSKAKTRTAGCVAYMAPERIDPPDPTSPDYDIRADVWSLGVSLVELAIGKFPYPNCTTDFEVLTKVIQCDPPKLPQNSNFSMSFKEFVSLCCTKEVRNRPKYKQLLESDFIRRSETTAVDMASWLQGVLTFSDDPFLSDSFTTINITNAASASPGSFSKSQWETFDR